eukprot:TRINITY_DN4037_c0_g1_i1.p1 TRINITY_DN4037_c0_g1~~TRINITY_DN4037_c0_g1_i1.p1  ORF type:complete len:799 (-),score=190.01 TRINITY_DN4037_c0_g1_i1:1347-3716(-)
MANSRGDIETTVIPSGDPENALPRSSSQKALGRRSSTVAQIGVAAVGVVASAFAGVGGKVDEIKEEDSEVKSFVDKGPLSVGGMSKTILEMILTGQTIDHPEKKQLPNSPSGSLLDDEKIIAGNVNDQQKDNILVRLFPREPVKRSYPVTLCVKLALDWFFLDFTKKEMTSMLVKVNNTTGFVEKVPSLHWARLCQLIEETLEYVVQKEVNNLSNGFSNGFQKDLLLGLWTNINSRAPYSMTVHLASVYARITQSYSERVDGDYVLPATKVKEVLQACFPSRYDKDDDGVMDDDVKESDELEQAVISAVETVNPKERDLNLDTNDMSRILRTICLNHARFSIHPDDVDALSLRFSASAMMKSEDHDDEDPWKELLEFSSVFFLPAFAVMVTIESGFDSDLLLGLLFPMIFQLMTYVSFIIFWILKYTLKLGYVITSTEACAPVLFNFLIIFFAIVAFGSLKKKKDEGDGEKKSTQAEDLKLTSEIWVTLRQESWKTWQLKGIDVYQKYIGWSDDEKFIKYNVILSFIASLMLGLIPTWLRLGFKMSVIGTSWAEKMIAFSFIFGGGFALFIFFLLVVGMSIRNLYGLNLELSMLDKLTSQNRILRKTQDEPVLPVMVMQTADDFRAWTCLRTYTVVKYMDDIDQIQSSIAWLFVSIVVNLIALYNARSQMDYQNSRSVIDVILLRILLVVLVICFSLLLVLAARCNGRLDDHMTFLKKLLYSLNETSFCGDPDVKKKLFANYREFISSMIGLLEVENDFTIFGFKISMSLLQSVGSVIVPVFASYYTYF